VPIYEYDVDDGRDSFAINGDDTAQVETTNKTRLYNPIMDRKVDFDKRMRKHILKYTTLFDYNNIVFVDYRLHRYIFHI
jgi:hypothetical protein